MGICDSKKKQPQKRRLDTFEDIDALGAQQTGEPPPTQSKVIVDSSEAQTPKDSDLAVPNFHAFRSGAANLVPSEKLSLIDKRDTLTSAIRQTNFFQNEVESSAIDKLYSESSEGLFTTEVLAQMLEQYVNICANFAKKEIQYQKEKLRKVRRENNIDVRPKSGTQLNAPPVIGRQNTGAMFGSGDRQGVSEDEAKQLFTLEVEQMKAELAADLAAMEAEECTSEPELLIETESSLRNKFTSDFMPTSDMSIIEMRASLGDANLQRKCGETIVTCNSFLSKLKNNPEAMLAGVPRKFRKSSFTNFLPNFLESYAKELGVFEVGEMAAQRSGDIGALYSKPVAALKLGDSVTVSVFILSMTCLDVDLPWDPVDYQIAEKQTIRQMNEHLFEEYKGLDAYKDKFRTTLVQDGHVMDIPAWHSNKILTSGDELTINF